MDADRPGIPSPPIRLGMVGGGADAFIGAVHRMAARLDGHFDFVAGALSATPERARASGRALGLAEARIYDDYETMAAQEAARDDGIEAVAIVTPNHMHALPALAFLKRGIHVICEKPLAATTDEAREIAGAVAQSGAIFVLTHNYTGYPMVRAAREMVAAGALGDLRVVQVEYAQDWLAEAVDSKQADWRTDPARSGAGAIGDIGTHAFNLAEFVTGLRVESLAAELSSFVPGRQVDDNAHVMLRLEQGARGQLWASQVAVGNENGLRLRVHGARGGLEWDQEAPDRLWFTPFGEAKRLLTRGGAGAGHAAERLTRVPAGHPEGYIEGFANIYAEAARAIRARQTGVAAPDVHFTTIDDGLRGMAFIAACLRSSSQDAAWVTLEP
jgi:predicted dehydrogenase